MDYININTNIAKQQAIGGEPFLLEVHAFPTYLNLSKKSQKLLY